MKIVKFTPLMSEVPDVRALLEKRLRGGKKQRCLRAVENCRMRDVRIVPRQVLKFGDINDGQRGAWCRVIEVLAGSSESCQTSRGSLRRRRAVRLLFYPRPGLRLAENQHAA